MNFDFNVSIIILLFLHFGLVTSQYLVQKNVYHSHHEVTKELRHLANVYPDRAHLYSIGTSAEGRDLWVLSVASHSPQKHLPLRPEISFVGNMHGDEAVGKELLLYLACYLLEFYNYDPMVREIMDNSRVHILPSMNPDGFASSIEGTCDGSVGRGNARKIDLNRNFPDFWESNDVEREPETEAIMHWLGTIPFALAANFHGGTLVANYPFDNNKDGMLQYSEAPDDDILKHLALTYSKTHRKMYDGQACGDSMETFTDGITNGADWYPVRGSLQDYQYAFRGIMATTLEISCCKYPKADSLVEYWRENRVPMLEYLKQANRGVRGYVLDSVTGAGIKAIMHIHGRRMKFFSMQNGEFYRILLPGVYIIKVQSLNDFYEPKSIAFTVPKGGLLLELNITLNYAVRISSKIHTSKLPQKFSKKTEKPFVTATQSSRSNYYETKNVRVTTENVANSTTETFVLTIEPTTIRSSTVPTTIPTTVLEENLEVANTNVILTFPTTLKPDSPTVHNMTVFAAISNVKEEPIDSDVASSGHSIGTLFSFFAMFLLRLIFSNIVAV